MSAGDKLAEAIAKVEALGPELAAAARGNDIDGLSAETVEALTRAGLFRLDLSPDRGGAGLSPAQIAQVLRALARGCAASAYVVALSLAGRSRLSAIAPETASEILDAAPDARFTLALMPQNASLAEAAGGHVLSGQWRAVGGLAHADWLWLVAPDRFSALVPKSEVLHAARTYLGGLRAVGWSDLSAGNAPVPAARFTRGGCGSADPSGLWTLAMVLGTAEGACNDYVTATRARIAGIGGKAVARFTQVQARLAETEAEMKTLAALFASVLADHEGAATGAETARDMAFIARRALEAVTRLVRQMGAMGLAETNPVQRRYRDLRTLAAARELAWDSAMAARGREVLGIDAKAQAA